MIYINAIDVIYAILNQEISVRKIKTSLFECNVDTRTFQQLMSLFGEGNNSSLKNVFQKLERDQLDDYQDKILNDQFEQGINLLAKTTIKNLNVFKEFVDEYFSETFYSNTSAFQDVSLNVVIKNAVLLFELNAISSPEVLLVNLDVSGIQSFIYQVSTSKALKSLRFRSFYVDIMVKTMQEQILTHFNLSTFHLLYNGGGNNYMVIPYTKSNEQSLLEVIEQYKKWITEYFQTNVAVMIDYHKIYVSELFSQDSSGILEAYKQLSLKKNKSKLRKYSIEQIKYLNSIDQVELVECSACGRLDHLNNDSKCSFCSLIEQSASKLFDATNNIYIDESSQGVPIPSLNKQLYINFKESSNGYIEYVKTGSAKKSNQRKYEFQDYSPTDKLDITLSELQTPRTNKLSMFMCDIDDMGSQFIYGPVTSANNDKRGFIKEHLNMTRTIMLSERVTYFFESKVKGILGYKNFLFNEQRRNVVVIYAGGDDLCIIGQWYDLVDLMIEIEGEWEKYCEGVLTISSAISLFNGKFPIKLIAEKTEEMLTLSKQYADANTKKDSITLFNEMFTLSKSKFYRAIELFEKFRDLSKKDLNNTFAYNLYTLLGESEEKLDLSKIAYIIGRQASNNKDVLGIYEDFLNKSEYTEIKLALAMLIYLKRED